MTNGLFQHISLEESTSIQSVKYVDINTVANIYIQDNITNVQSDRCLDCLWMFPDGLSGKQTRSHKSCSPYVNMAGTDGDVTVQFKVIECNVYWRTLLLLYVRRPFVILGVSGLFCRFYPIFDGKSC